MYQVEERHHACSILNADFPEQWKDLLDVLREFKLRRSDIAKKGGNKSPISRAINGLFFERGWVEKSFDIKVTADGEETLAPTHHVDYYKNRIAIETEWNNKDPFFDRDLTTFRLPYCTQLFPLRTRDFHRKRFPDGWLIWLHARLSP